MNNFILGPLDTDSISIAESDMAPMVKERQNVGRPKGIKDVKKRKPRNPTKALEMVGKKYGKLTILGLNEQNNRNPLVDVICDCGVKKTINAYSVRRRTISCGCAQKESVIKRQYKGEKVSCINRLLANYKANAKNRNIEFSLTHDQIKTIIFNNCYYCEQPPYMTITTYSGTITYNGIDRIDNSIGYVISNCVPSCKPCNIAKHSISKEMVLKLYNYYYAK